MQIATGSFICHQIQLDRNGVYAAIIANPQLVMMTVPDGFGCSDLPTDKYGHFF
jgi:hypothetical protein